MTSISNLILISPGIDLYCEQHGQGAPALVFVHGGGGWTDHWQLQLPYFATLTTVLAYDLRGHGRSSVPVGPYSIETFAEDLHRLLSQLQIERPILVGHSLGGTIALRYAFDFPDHVTGIAILDSGCSSTPVSRHVYRELVLARAQEYAKAQASLQRYNSSPDSGRADFVQRILAETPAPPPAVINATHFGIITHNNAAAASFINCPTLVIGASDMDYWPSMQSWLDYIPHAHLIAIPHSGHYLMLEQPELVNAALEEFWQSVVKEEQGQ